MTATPKNGAIVLRGKSGRSYNLSFYNSDVVGAFCTFNLNGAAVAGSQNFFIVPEDCIIEDVSIATGIADTTSGVIQLNDANTGNVVVFANQVNTLATRVKPMVALSRGAKLTILQQ